MPLVKSVFIRGEEFNCYIQDVCGIEGAIHGKIFIENKNVFTEIVQSSYLDKFFSISFFTHG